MIEGEFCIGLLSTDLLQIFFQNSSDNKVIIKIEWAFLGTTGMNGLLWFVVDLLTHCSFDVEHVNVILF